MSGRELVFSEITNSHAPEFDALLRIYDEAIPASERKPAATIRAMATSPTHRVEIAMMEKDVTGFALTYLGRGIDLLEYLAVAGARRGAGLGAALFERARTGTHPLLVEVESDRVASGDQRLRARRIGFYRRLGCRRLENLAFVLPLPVTGQPPTIDLLVCDWIAPHVPHALLREWVEEIYEGVYGQPRRDPRIDAMLENLPPLVPLN